MSTYKSKKIGVALKAQKELEVLYDIEEKAGIPDRLVTWMNKVLEGEHPACYGSSWRKMQFWLRDGTALCKFVNKIRESTGLPAVKFNKNALTPFIALENIASFNKGASEYGVDQDCLFQGTDLYDGIKGPFAKVIICLRELGNIANEKGFSPRFDAPPHENSST